MKRSRNSRPARKPLRKDRGIVLLVVVSLLALFILLGVSFALIATQYRIGARAQAEIQRFGDDHRTELEQIFRQVLSDTQERSSIHGGSLLLDMYGRDYYAYSPNQGATAQPRNGGQVWAISVPDISRLGPGSPKLGQLNGRVFTFGADVNGSPINVSTRTLAFDPNSPFQFLIEAPAELSTLPASGFGFYVNGSPFNGTGAGYNRSTQSLDLSFSLPGSGGVAHPLVLMPHYAGFPQTTGVISFAASHGGLDESYDAPDFQNPFLAMVPPGAAAQYGPYVASIPTPAPYPLPASPAGLAVIPSFHRPDLVNYWRNLSGANFDSNPDLQRCVIFRPSPADHPNFTGSNPRISQNPATWVQQMASLNPHHWDVDNDGDGMPDSVWIDPGLPVVTAPDGRRYKRLAAILIKDLDGRINVNAHGNLAQVNSTTPPGIGVAVGSGDGRTPNNYRADSPLPGNFGLARMGAYLPRGMGYGPAEVDFRRIFVRDPMNPDADNPAYASILAQRYGGDLSTDAAPGAAGGHDSLAVLQQQQVPNNYTGGPVAGAAYASPPDVWGRGVIALDNGGKAVSYFMGLTNELLDNPYEHDPYSADTAVDSPYQPVELEALLRYHDADVTRLKTGSRLLAGDLQNYLATANTQGVITGEHARREKLTTISSHVSAPITAGPAWLRARISSQPFLGSFGEEVTILDLYRHRLAIAGVTSDAAQATALAQIAPFEFFQGRPFNINRWLGDGLDSNGNSVIDEQQEVGGPAWNTGGEPAGFGSQTGYSTNGFDANGDGTVNNIDARLARQLYARHLFCLAMLCVDDNLGLPTSEGLGQPQRRRLLVHRLAQWAVNCVDFRDPDAVMTAFEYDANPFTDDDGNSNNGTWEVDGFAGVTPGNDAQLFTMDDGTSGDDAQSYRGLAWGVEFPDLLITETFAMHDRRVKDTASDDGPKKKRDEPMNEDKTMDQFRVPQGSAFVELYCPAHIAWPNRKAPQELYNNSNRLKLGAMVPDAASGQNRPVWRLAFTRIYEQNLATKRPFDLASTKPDTATFDPDPLNFITGQSVTLDRFVWFSSAAEGAGWLETDMPEGGRTFYSTRPATVEPGSYVVVGPRTTTHFGSQDPTKGAAGAGLRAENSLARIVDNGTSFAFWDFAGNPVSEPNSKPHVSVVADMRLPDAWPQKPWRVGLNVTEPLPQAANYYPPPPFAPGFPDYYDDPEAPITQSFLDRPLDNRDGRPIDQATMVATQTYQNRSIVYLQRLADPTQRFHPVGNPYITVDFSQLDVTVYNGEDNNRQRVKNNTEWIDLDDPDPANPGSNPVFLRGKERGKRALGANGYLWPPIIRDWAPGDQSMPDNPTDFMFYTFGAGKHTLGWLNAAISTPLPAPNLGEPSQPFPWLGWHNRPFMNPMELLLVPSSTQPRLCYEFTPSDLTVPASPFDETSNTNDDKEFRAFFRHLLNFFQSSSQTANPSNALQLYQLLDFVETPSPFMRTVKWYDPGSFSSQQGYAPPFNHMSRFRDPGRININTIFDEDIWKCAVGEFPGMNNDAFARKVFRSRRNEPGNWLAAPSGSSPSIFGNPFRAAHSADLAPPPLRITRSVGATFLRPDPDVPNPARPLFGKSALEPNASVADPHGDYGQDEAVDVDPYHSRNAYFRYQALQKIGNIFTTRSNCYAVWITVGYFEVEENPGGPDDAHPDGYRLAAEIGADSGEIQRHRAFYLVDRAIPVGFVPGQKLNTDQCVLLRRIIE